MWRTRVPFVTNILEVVRICIETPVLSYRWRWRVEVKAIVTLSHAIMAHNNMIIVQCKIVMTAIDKIVCVSAVRFSPVYHRYVVVATPGVPLYCILVHLVYHYTVHFSLQQTRYIRCSADIWCTIILLSVYVSLQQTLYIRCSGDTCRIQLYWVIVLNSWCGRMSCFHLRT